MKRENEAAGSIIARAQPRLQSETCRICDADSATADVYCAREMMFGFRDEFVYFQCNACGCLQIDQFPSDIGRYYPSKYYAHEEMKELSSLKAAIRRQRDQYAIEGHGALGKALHRWAPYPRGEAFRWFPRTGISHTSRVLDVGCGNGALLRDLRGLGYQNLVGIDPFISESVTFDDGVTVIRGTLEELSGDQFELIMLHHSLEHIPNQQETLESVRRLLAPEGVCVIRIPVASSFAWEHYKEDWVQLDAPRHFFLHTTRSMDILAACVGLQVVDVQYDSTEFQFVGSEMYRRNVPLQTPPRGIFSERELEDYRSRARELNARKTGDSAAFFLRRPRASG